MRRSGVSHDQLRKLRNGAEREKHCGACEIDEVLWVRTEPANPIESMNEECTVTESEGRVLPGTSNCTRFFHASADRDDQGVSELEPYRQALR